MDLEVSGSSKQSEEDKDTPHAAVEVQSEVPEEQSPKNVVAEVFVELAPQEEVAESESGGAGELVEAPSFALRENKEGELPSTCQSSSPLPK